VIARQWRDRKVVVPTQFCKRGKGFLREVSDQRWRRAAARGEKIQPQHGLLPIHVPTFQEFFLGSGTDTRALGYHTTRRSAGDCVHLHTLKEPHSMRQPRRSRHFSSMLLSALVAGPLASQTPGTSGVAGAPIPTIEAGGDGEAKIAPDRATIYISVQNRARTSALAGSENATKVAAVLDAIRKLGIAREQITTANYSVNPSYRYFPDARRPELTGYDANNTVQVEVRALEMTGRVIDAALGAGATNIGGVNFFASQLDATRRVALGNATSDARMNAEAMAKAAGGTLGQLLTLTTQEVSRVMFAQDENLRGRAMAVSATAAAEPTPISTPSEQTVNAHVTGRWQFIPAPR
jgi:uncharacterized protein